MDLEAKAAILNDFSEANSGASQWEDFFAFNDLGIPYAIGVASGHIIGLSEDGERFVESTWDQLCTSLGVEPSEEFMSLEDLLGKSEG